MVKQEKFDGILPDLEMPTLSRFDLARLIRKSSWNKSTPIVKVTGSAERKTMQDAFAIGETFFIQKPVDRQKLSVSEGERGFMYSRLPNRTRGVSWEPKHGRNAGRSEWLEIQRRSARIVSTANFWSRH